MTPAVFIRWTARAWSVASAAVLLLFAFGGAESLRMSLFDLFGFLLFPIGVIVGLAIAWRRELAGGLVSVASIVLFYAWLLVRDGAIPTTPYFLLLAAPGFLFLALGLAGRARLNDPRPG